MVRDKILQLMTKISGFLNFKRVKMAKNKFYWLEKVRKQPVAPLRISRSRFSINIDQSLTAHGILARDSCILEITTSFSVISTPRSPSWAQAPLHLLHDVRWPWARASTVGSKSPHSRGLEYKSLTRTILVTEEIYSTVLSRREATLREAKLNRSECFFPVSCKSERLTTIILIDLIWWINAVKNDCTPKQLTSFL